MSNATPAPGDVREALYYARPVIRERYPELRRAVDAYVRHEMRRQNERDAAMLAMLAMLAALAGEG